MKEQVIALKIHLSALKKPPHSCCLGLSRCCSSSHSWGMTSSAGTTLCYHIDTLQCSRAVWKAPNYSFLTKTTQFFLLFLWNFPWVVFRCPNITWKPNPFPFAERRGESSISKLAFSFPRNHKNLQKSMHSFASDWQKSHPTGQVNMQILFWLLKTNKRTNPPHHKTPSKHRSQNQRHKCQCYCSETHVRGQGPVAIQSSFGNSTFNFQLSDVLPQVSDKFGCSARQLFHEGCVQLVGLPFHCSCGSALAPSPHVLTHIRDAKLMSLAAMLMAFAQLHQASHALFNGAH